MIIQGAHVVYSKLLYNSSSLFFLSGIKCSPDLNSHNFLLCWENSQKFDGDLFHIIFPPLSTNTDFHKHIKWVRLELWTINFPRFSREMLFCEALGQRGILTVWKAICIPVLSKGCFAYFDANIWYYVILWIDFLKPQAKEPKLPSFPHRCLHSSLSPISL